MVRLLGLLVLAAVAIPAAAAMPIVNDSTRAYEVIVVDAPVSSQIVYLGELEGYPEMYEINAGEPFTLYAEVHQLATEPLIPFSLIAVRQNDRGGGVREVARVHTSDSSWQRSVDPRYNIPLAAATPISISVEPGVYRVEVSTPENFGRYMLRLGTLPVNDGFFTELAHIRAVQEFFGISWFRFLGVTPVLYLLGCLLVLCGIGATWWYRERIRTLLVERSTTHS
jgi:hypothetical protein